MSFNPPEGILDIGNATLRVGKLEVAETTGLNQGLQNIVKNDLLITEKETYLANKTWGIKLPTAWVGEFDLKTHDNKYVEFNFYNEGSTSNAFGYTLNFKDTTLTLKYDNGNNLASETIPDVSTSTYKKVNVFFERGVIAVFIDGARVLYFKESDTYNSVHGHPGVASRVVSTTGGSFVNIFIEADGSDSAVKDLRIVNGRFISDKTSNVSFIGSLGVGVNNPKESLDIRGNMHLTRVSNISQVSVDSNVVTEYTGPHNRPLRKYPEVNLTADAETGSGYNGYKVTASNDVDNNSNLDKFRAFNGITGNEAWGSGGSQFTSGTGAAIVGGDSLGNVEGQWLKLQLPLKIKLSHIKLTSRDIAGIEYPKDFQILGSNDDSNWTQLINVVDAPYTQNLTLTHYVTGTVDSFQYLAVVVTKTHGGTGVTISELEYYGYEEGSGSLDTTLKSVYNVPATTGTQLEVYYDGQDYTAGTTVNDLALPANNGTLNGGVGIDPTYKAFTFNGTSSQNITSSALGFTGDQPHTFSFWIKDNEMDHTSTYVMHIGRTTHAASQNSSIEFRSDRIRWASYANDIEYPLTGITSNTWYHITGSYVGGGATPENKSLYINGKRFDDTGYNVFSGWEATAGDPLSFQSDAFVTLGSSTAIGTTHFNGSIANFRLYSKALNTDQVKELYDYQKDYFLGSKSQVTLYKGHLGVGVTEPSGQLELAGDERIQEYPPGPLTNYETHIPGHGVFCWYTPYYYQGDFETHSGVGMYAKDEGTTGWYGPYNGNSGYTGGNVYAGTDFAATSSSGLGFNDAYGTRYYGAWTTFKLPYKINLKGLRIRQWGTAESVNSRCAPEDGVILGSNDGTKWYHVHTFTGLQYGGSAGSYSFSAAGEYVTINCNTDYNQYVLITTRTLHYAFTVIIGELRWFGTPGPTTLDKGSLTLGRSLDVPRVSRYDVDTETPRPEKLVLDLDTTVNSTPTDISGKGNHGNFEGAAEYSEADKAFTGFPNPGGIAINYIKGNLSGVSGAYAHTQSYWINGADTTPRCPFTVGIETGNYSYLNIWLTTSKWVLNADGAASGEWAETIYDNRWYHVVLTYDGGSSTSSYKLYINGEYKTPTTAISITTSLALPSNPEYRIGRNDGTQWYNGMVSNPKVYSVVLEPSEIRKLYNLGRTGRSMVISDTAVGIGKAPEAQLDVRGSLAVRGDVEAYGKNFNMSPAGNLSILGSIYGASVTAPYLRSHYDRYGFDGNWRTLIGTSAQDCGIGHLVNETGHQYAVFWFAHAGNGTGYVGWIQNGGYTNIAYSGSNIKVQGPVNTITRAYVLYLNNG